MKWPEDPCSQDPIDDYEQVKYKRQAAESVLRIDDFALSRQDSVKYIPRGGNRQ